MMNNHIQTSLDYRPTVEGRAGICQVCGDHATGKHYGIWACYGCKGFFRRTITAGRRYNCRFDDSCKIDKNQRNGCRHCRFQLCIRQGMAPDAIRPDRDLIGRQRNPRRNRRADEALPEPADDKTDMHYAVLIQRLLSCDQNAKLSNDAPFPFHPEQDLVTLGDLFDPPYPMTAAWSQPLTPTTNQFASMDDTFAGFRRCLQKSVFWINRIGDMIPGIQRREKVELLKNAFHGFALWQICVESYRLNMPNQVALCNNKSLSLPLNWDSCPRSPFAVPDDPKSSPPSTWGPMFEGVCWRMINEIIEPLHRVRPSEEEAALVCAIIILENPTFTLRPETRTVIEQLKDRLSCSLMYSIRRGGCEDVEDVQRFSHILNLLPAVARVSCNLSDCLNLSRVFNQLQEPLLRRFYDILASGDNENCLRLTDKDFADVVATLCDKSL